MSASPYRNAGSITPDRTLLGYTNAQNFSKAAAKMLANWFISDSGGTGHAAWITLPAVSSSTDQTADFKAFVRAHCSKCSVDSDQESLALLASGGIASAMVSAVQADPTIKYIFAPVGSATTGLRAALDAAGYQDVKIAGVAATYQNFLNIASGAESAWVQEGKRIEGFDLVDAGLHGAEGPSAQYKSDIYGPLVLVTKHNLAKLGGPEAAKATGAFELPTNYVHLFKADWRVK